MGSQIFYQHICLRDLSAPLSPDTTDSRLAFYLFPLFYFGKHNIYERVARAIAISLKIVWIIALGPSGP